MNPFKFLHFIFLATSILFSLPVSNAFPAQVTLAWDANPNAKIVGYKVHYGSSSGNYQGAIDVGNTTTYTISNLPDGITYYFAATDYDTSGVESGYSNEVIYSSVPPPPVNLSTDILWRNTATGQIMVWYMNGANITSSAYLNTVPLPWYIVGTGDFNNDGKPDILWRQPSTGENVVWYMNGANITSSASLVTVPPPWQIEGVGDFNSDGKPDILWRQASTGDVVVWYMNGVNITSSASLGTVPPPWQIEGVGDFNSDGKPDILWRQASTGDVAVWDMNRVNITSSAYLGTVPPPWQIEGR